MPEGMLHRRKRDPWNPRFSRSFVVCVPLAVVAGVGLIIGARSILEADKFERHNYDLISRLQETRGSFRSAVANMRAYMLSPDSFHQRAFGTDMDVTRANLDQLSDLTNQGAESIKLYGDYN